MGIEKVYIGTLTMTAQKTRGFGFGIKNKNIANVPDYSNSTKANFAFNNDWVHFVVSYNSTTGSTDFYCNGKLIESADDVNAAVKDVRIIEANNSDDVEV
ncbi:MAG: hypothetical protein ACOX19_07065 [Fermentimonas sp.]|jgi:hypothetical protein